MRKVQVSGGDENTHVEKAMEAEVEDMWREPSITYTHEE